MKIDWIDDKLGISGAIDNYNDLHLHKVNAIINLRSEQHDDICELTKRSIAYYWIPVADWGAPRSDQIDLFLRLTTEIKGKILVHCAVGKGRSAMLCIAYLLSRFNKRVKTIEEGLIWLENVGHHTKLWHTQYDKLKEHFKL